MSYRLRLPVTDAITPQDWDALVDMAKTNPTLLKTFIGGKEAPVSETKEVNAYNENRPHSIEELAALYRIDLTQYEVVIFKPNMWPVGAKHPETGEILTQMLFQTKATFRPRRSSSIDLVKQELLEAVRALPPFEAPALPEKPEANLAVEIDIFDFHLGKIGVGDDSWALDRAHHIWQAALQSLVGRLDLARVEKFLLPCGNDFLHIDNSKGLTYNGTPVGASASFTKLLVMGKELLCQGIQYLSQYAPVDVIFISGNHDRDSTFSIGEMVAERFRDRADVNVVNSDKLRQYWRYGTSLVGFTHGDTVKLDKIGGMMVMEAALDYAQTTYRAFHVGHLHHRRKDQLTIVPNVQEAYGIDVEVVPSLSPKDRWHESQGFIGAMRRAKAFVYHRAEGLVDEHHYNLR